MPASSGNRNPYAGSINPARRAKRRPTSLALSKVSDIPNILASDSDQDQGSESDFHPNNSAYASGQSAFNTQSGYLRSHNVPILPKKQTSNLNYTSTDVRSGAISTSNGSTSAGPSRRGRKPGTMSRSAREAQRKLNHSIIEKARRTKINDALTTLRELVPADFGRGRGKGEEIGDSDTVSKAKAKGREEKEREFKLEILVRTVAYMKELLDMVKRLENSVSTETLCSRCASSVSTDTVRKRKWSIEEGDTQGYYNEVQEEEQRAKKRSMSGSRYKHQLTSTDDGNDAECSSGRSLHPLPLSRLPSISSWLSTTNNVKSPLSSPPILNTLSNPSPPPVHHTHRNDLHVSRSSGGSQPQLELIQLHASSQLPSPPLSTRVHATNESYSGIPPQLNLGPVASASTFPVSSMVMETRATGKAYPSSQASVGSRTPEDESAASLLLEISASAASLSAPMLPYMNNEPSAGTSAIGTGPGVLSGEPQHPMTLYSSGIVPHHRASAVRKKGSSFSAARELTERGFGTDSCEGVDNLTASRVEVSSIPPTILPQTPSSLLGMTRITNELFHR